MAMWYSVPVKKIIVPVIHFQICTGNDILINLLDFIDFHVYKLSTGDEVTRSTLATVIQVIAKKRQDRQIWDANDGVTLRRKAMQIKWLQDVKESTPRLNDDLGITIGSAEHFVKKKK